MIETNYIVKDLYSDRYFVEERGTTKLIASITDAMKYCSKQEAIEAIIECREPGPNDDDYIFRDSSFDISSGEYVIIEVYS